MITTTYTCDRCKAVVDKGKLFTIIFSATSVNGSAQYGTQTIYNSYSSPAHWCRDCLHSSGFFKPQKPEPGSDKPAPPATIEELIRELIASALEEHNNQ